MPLETPVQYTMALSKVCLALWPWTDEQGGAHLEKPFLILRGDGDG